MDVEPEALLELAATDRQREIVNAYIANGGNAMRAADALGVARGTVRKTLKRLERRAQSDELTPGQGKEIEAIPDGFSANRVTTLYDAKGKPKLRWVRANKEDEEKRERIDRLFEAFESRASSIDPLPPIAPPSVDLTPDLLNVIPIGDPHLGMLSWERETGDNFDLRIAEQEFQLFVDLLFARVTPAPAAVILSLGDFFHAHDDTHRTKRSGHNLDVDGRNPKIFDAGAEVIIRAIQRALQTHLWVCFRSLTGNHDDFLAYAVAAVVKKHFRNNPRVWVDCDPSNWWWLEFGECLLGGTHGHSAKPDRMRDAMIVDKAEAWGRTRFRHLYAGHVHHNSRIELAGVRIEYMRNIAPRDAHAAAGGWRSQQDLRCDTWHRTQGLINSAIVPRELVKAVLRERSRANAVH